jgi:hypothetical protein
MARMPDATAELATVQANLRGVNLTAVVGGEQDVLMLEHNLTVGEALRVSESPADLVARPAHRCRDRAPLISMPPCSSPRHGRSAPPGGPHHPPHLAPPQVLARRGVLSAPLVIQPGLEDTESLVPG